MQTDSIPAACRSAIVVALVTAFLLLIPLLAMQITDEVVWDVADFAVAGALLFGTGLAYALAARKLGSGANRLALGVALAAALCLVWLNLAVGIIGEAGNPANLMYFGVVAVGIIGSAIVRLRPRRMALVLLLMAIAQALVAVVAFVGEPGSPPSRPGEILVLNAFLVALFAGSAWLFRREAGGTQ